MSTEEDEPNETLHAICPHLSESLCPSEEDGEEFPEPNVDLINALTAKQAVCVFNTAVDLVKESQETVHAGYSSGILLGAFVINPLFGRVLSALTHHLEKLKCPTKTIDYYRMREVYESVQKNGYPYDLNTALYRRVTMELARFGTIDTEYDQKRNIALWGNKHLVLDNMERATMHDLLYAACWSFEPADQTVVDAMSLDQTVEMFNHLIKCDDTVCWTIVEGDGLLSILSDKLEDLKCPVDRLVDFDTLCDLDADDINWKLRQRVAHAAAQDGKRILKCLRERDGFKLSYLTGALEEDDEIDTPTAIAMGRLLFERLKSDEVRFSFEEI